MISKGAKPVIGKCDVIVTTVFNRKFNKSKIKFKSKCNYFFSSAFMYFLLTLNVLVVCGKDPKRNVSSFDLRSDIPLWRIALC